MCSDIKPTECLLYECFMLIGTFTKIVQSIKLKQCKFQKKNQHDELSLILISEMVIFFYLDRYLKIWNVIFQFNWSYTRFPLKGNWFKYSQLLNNAPNRWGKILKQMFQLLNNYLQIIPQPGCKFKPKICY